MKNLAATLLTVLLVIGAPASAFGWGDKGHQTVGQIAQLRLQNTNALVRINQILRPGETLSSIATWADGVKNENSFRVNAVHPDPDTQHFFRHLVNTHNRNWHFVDLPLHCGGYDDPACHSFTSNTDIVSIINLCIRKLRGENIQSLTKRNALRLLVHLIGDLHQPLHVGVGFVNIHGPNNTIVIERDPAVITQHPNAFPSDTGGNDLLITGAVSPNLHAFWDSDLVELARGNQGVPAFAATLNMIPAAPSWDGQGNTFTWASQWASDTLRVSNQNAYDSSISLNSMVIIDGRRKYKTTRGPNYGMNNAPVVRQQLAKGGYRLAKLLQAIFP